MVFTKKGGMLIFVTALLFYFLGNRCSNSSLKEALQAEINRNLAIKQSVEEVEDNLRRSGNWTDTTHALAGWLYKHYAAKNAAVPNLSYVERKKSWEETVADIHTELSFCGDWFDTIGILSAWLYQNTRVGNLDFNIEKTFGDDFNKWVDTVRTLPVQWFYDSNTSDSVTSNCGSHGYYALRLYEYFGIKSYHLSFRSKRQDSFDGHLINVIQNPHNQKWYPIDHLFGLRYRYKGNWLDMETYFKLSREELFKVDVETFGVYKFHIYESPFISFNDWSLETIEIASIELANHKNYFRVLAPNSLSKQFLGFKKLFDLIAESYGEPPHVDWIDLARRMPLYSAKLYSPVDFGEQGEADSLLLEWRSQ